MKLHHILSLVFVIVFTTLTAQDTIQFTNGNKVVAKILEISPSTIKYKQANYLDGPDYIEEKRNIISISYANGIKDNFIQVTSPAKVDTLKSVSQPTVTLGAVHFPYKNNVPYFSKIGGDNERYYFVDNNNAKISRYIGINRILRTAGDLAEQKKNDPLKHSVDLTKRNKRLQIVFGIVGAPLVVVGAASGLVSGLVYATASTAEDQDAASGLAVVAATLCTAGISFEVTSLVNGVKKKKRLKETVDLYNQGL